MNMATLVKAEVSLSLLITLFMMVFAVTQSKQASKPHILYMLVDDWGWADVGYHRDPPTKEVVTPNIDSLVKTGLELDQYYVFQFCSPSRSSLLTGRLPIHVNDLNLPPGHYNPKDPVSGYAGIPRNMTGIAEKMKEAGYATHMVGKWHVGMATPDHIPTGRGFTTSYGYLTGVNDYYTEQNRHCNITPIVDLWNIDRPANEDNGTEYEEALFKEHLFDVVSKHDPSTPLFLYYTPHIVHAPLEVPQNYENMFSFIDDHDRRIYHAMVKYLDDLVGELIELLKSKGIWDNLLFVTSSDNGGPIYPGGGANNFPLKGGKISDWQGGVRVNAFVSGGYLPEKMRGQKTDAYIHIADWYGTFCGLAGVNSTDEKAAKANLPPVESMDLWPLISGQSTVSPRVDIPISYNTLISGDYKILVGDVPQAGWTGPHYPNTSKPEGISVKEHCGDGGCLYNIKEDPEERVNLVTSMPDVLKEMQTKLAEYQATYFNPDRGGIWPGACETALNKYDGFWGPFLN